MVQLTTLNLTASDVTGQKHVEMRDVPVSYSIGQFIDDLLPQMNLAAVDRAGQRVNFDARLEREARHLHRSELVGEALQDDDHVVLHPKIYAGGRPG